VADRLPFPFRAARVAELVASPEVADMLVLLAGEQSLDRPIIRPRIQKSGLVLVGHTRGFSSQRVQVLGETEISYLEGLGSAERRARAEALFALEVSLVVVTRGVEVPEELLAAARSTETPLAVARPRSSEVIRAIHQALDRIMAPTERVHGVLIDIHGIGALVLGPSGIGKSEVALFLVERGHRLVADDQVILTRLANNSIRGTAPALLRHHLEVRGIGIINVRDLFGATAVRDVKTVQLVVELCPWREDETYDRLGIDDLRHDVLGLELPKLRVPVQPGRNMAVILEVAARNQILKGTGHDAARDFVRSLSAGLGVQDPSGDEEGG